MTVAPWSAALQPVSFTASLHKDSPRQFDGIDNFQFDRLDTRISTPILERRPYVGTWLLGADFTESRFNISTDASSQRRFYRISTPVQYWPRRVGQWQHRWHFEPAHYSDESLIDQTRYEFEYAWQAKYWVNNKVGWVAGVSNDSRFGGAQFYPVFGLEARPSAAIHHYWVFPDMYSVFQLGKSTWRLFLEPDGGNWRFLQDDGTVASFALNEWTLGLDWSQSIHRRWRLKLSVGMKTMGQGSVAGADGNLTDAFYFSVGLISKTQLSRSSGGR